MRRGIIVLGIILATTPGCKGAGVKVSVDDQALRALNHASDSLTETGSHISEAADKIKDIDLTGNRALVNQVLELDSQLDSLRRRVDILVSQSGAVPISSAESSLLFRLKEVRGVVHVEARFDDKKNGRLVLSAQYSGYRGENLADLLDFKFDIARKTLDQWAQYSKDQTNPQYPLEAWDILIRLGGLSFPAFKQPPALFFTRHVHGNRDSIDDIYRDSVGKALGRFLEANPFSAPTATPRNEHTLNFQSLAAGAHTLYIQVTPLDLLAGHWSVIFELDYVIADPSYAGQYRSFPLGTFQVPRFDQQVNLKESIELPIDFSIGYYEMNKSISLAPTIH